MSVSVSQELRRLHAIAIADLPCAEETLVVDPHFSFDVMQPRALSMFFHWPQAIADAASASAVGAVLATLASRGEVGPEAPGVSRGALLYDAPAAAELAGATLAPWLVDSLTADPDVLTVERAPHPRLGDAVLWSLRGTMSRSDDVTVDRADLGWRSGPVLAFVVAFGADPLGRCGLAATQMDASINS